MQGSNSGFYSWPVLFEWSNEDEVDGARNTFLEKEEWRTLGFVGKP